MIYKQTIRSIALLAIASALLLLTPVGVQAEDAQWRARYWNNKSFSGDPVLEQLESRIDYDWGTDAPNDAVGDDDFAIRWDRDIDFDEGLYQFSATMDDGMRVWVDEDMVLDAWFDGRDRTVTVDVYIADGEHEITVEFYDNAGTARAKFDWEKVDIRPIPAVNWHGEYFNNDTLSGSPVLVRDDAEVNFDWGTGSPASNVSSDHFSARWRRTVSVQAGTYYFTVLADDGVRLRVNGDLIVDAWQAQAVTSFTGQKTFATAGQADIELEYFEQKGLATVQLSWSQTTPTAVSPAAAPIVMPEGLTAVMTQARHLNVRSGPGLDFDPFTALSNGDVVGLVARDASGIWVKIRLASGSTGWVSGRFLTSGTPLGQLPVQVD